MLRRNLRARGMSEVGQARTLGPDPEILLAGLMNPHNPVPVPTRFQEGSGGVARGVSVAKRRVPPRATARTALPFRTEPIRREQPPDSCAPKRLVRTCAPAKRPQLMPSGETAPSSASTGTGWGCGGSCVYVCVSRARSTGGLHGAVQREVHHARRTKMVRRY